MKSVTKFKIIGIGNNIAKLQRVGDGFLALAEGANFIGSIGDIVEVLEKDYTPEGDLSGYQAMHDRYEFNGVSGQDRQNYTDNQDRENYQY